MVGDKLIVSTASEAEWFDNIVELGWRLYFVDPPYLMQTADLRMREYTDLAFKETWPERKVRDSLDPVREAIRSTRPGKTQCACEILATVVGPGRWASAPADARPYGGRKGLDCRGLRALRSKGSNFKIDRCMMVTQRNNGR